MASGQDTFEAILQEQSYITYVAETPAGRSAGYLTLELRGDWLVQEDGCRKVVPSMRFIRFIRIITRQIIRNITIICSL